MRRFVLLFALLAQLAIAAQDTRTIDGRKYTVHVVQAGQTLYAIARSYAVPVDALIAANPGSVNGLRVGQELLVPKDAVVRKEARIAPEITSDGGLKHTVAKKETVFGIARKYGVDVNELLRSNPGIDSGLREGSVIIIPVATVTGVGAPVLRPADDATAVDHVVQQGETLYAIGQRFGVKPEEIQAANGGLVGGLKAGMTIRIPKRGGDVGDPVVVEAPVPAQSLYRVAFLLPFASSRNDSLLEATAAAEGGPRFYEPTRIAAQFYAGAQIALDSLVKRGLVADVIVKDVGDDPRQWGPALKDEALAHVDLSIGPFHRSAIEQLTRSHPRTRVICPVPQSNKVVLGQPQVSKVAPSRSDLVKHSGRYVASRFARENILLLRPDIASEKELQEQAVGAINATLATTSVRYRDSVAVVRTGRRDLGDLAIRLDAARTNLVMVPSEDVEYAATVVTRLKPLASKFTIILVGMEEWLHMDPLAAPDLDVLGFHFAAPSFFDPADSAVVRFTQQFRDRFHTDVDEYALLGFDVTFHFLMELMEHGPAFSEANTQDSAEILHMGFRMGRTGPENGLRNEYAVMLRQKDLKLEKAP